MPSTLANDVLTEAEARGIEGLWTERDPVRTYPAHDVAANLVGFVGTDESFGGLEQVFDRQLSGTDGSARYEVGGGNRIPLGTNETESTPSTGRTSPRRSTGTCSGTPSGSSARRSSRPAASPGSR